MQHCIFHNTGELQCEKPLVSMGSMQGICRLQIRKKKKKFMFSVHNLYMWEFQCTPMFALENLHLSTNVNQSLLQTMISGYLPVVGRAAIRNISIVPLRQAPASPFSFRIAFLYAALLKKKPTNQPLLSGLQGSWRHTFNYIHKHDCVKMCQKDKMG